MPGDAHFYGLGDKLGSFDRRNQAYTLWNTDVGPQESTDPLYKSIPFFLATSGARSYGLFLDNTWRTWFDFGKQARDERADRLVQQLRGDGLMDEADALRKAGIEVLG